MNKRCLKCGKMVNIPESLKNSRICCPNCKTDYKIVNGTLIREVDVPELGMPEENIEKREYAPVLGTNNGEITEESKPKGLWGFIKHVFGY